MPQEREAPTLADYAAIVARRWRVVVVTALVFMLLGAAWSVKGGNSYTSNASLVIRPILSDPVGTLVLNIAFTATTPERAQAGARAFAQAYLDYRRANAEDTKKRTLARFGKQRAQMNTDLAASSAQIAANPVGSDARTDAEARQNVLVT